MPTDSRIGADDWVTQFLAFTEDTPSPDQFRLWSAITGLAGVMERKVWLTIQGKMLYPHMFTILVGPPGSGKTFVTDVIEEMWRSTKEHHVAPKSMSYASLGDVLKDAERKLVMPNRVPSFEQFNSLLIHCRELKVLVPEYSSQMLDRLTDLWDCKVWDERLRGGGINYVVEKPQITILAGETPSWFNSMIPDNAWEGGFLSRTVLVYAGEQRRRSLFSAQSLDNPRRKVLELAMKSKGQRFGQMAMDQEVADAIQEWYYKGGPPVPEHPKLRHYLSRRHVHLLKLMMVSSISRSNALVIHPVDFERALEWLITAERDIEEIFKLAATAGDGKVIEDAWYFLHKEFVRSGGVPIRASVLSRFISARVPSHSVAKVIEVMIVGNYVKQQYHNGDHAFVPGNKLGD